MERLLSTPNNSDIDNNMIMKDQYYSNDRELLGNLMSDPMMRSYNFTGDDKDEDDDDDDDKTSSNNKNNNYIRLVLAWRRRNPRKNRTRDEAEAIAILDSTLGKLSRVDSLHFLAYPYSVLPGVIMTRTTTMRSSLTSLVIGGATKLRELPADIARLHNLKCLRIVGCNFTHLPIEIGALKNLSFLQIEACHPLLELPTQLVDLVSLEELLIFHCDRLERIPAEIVMLRNLRVFEVKGCIRMRTLPRGMQLMSQLDKMIVNKHACAAFPATRKISWKVVPLREQAEVVEPTSRSTQEFRISDCPRLGQLPHYVLPDFQKLRFLTLLSVTSIPVEVQDLVHLESLELGFVLRSALLDFFSSPWSAKSAPKRLCLCNLTWALAVDEYETLLPGVPNSLVELRLERVGVNDLNGFIRKGLPPGLRIFSVVNWDALHRSSPPPRDEPGFDISLAAWRVFDTTGRSCIHQIAEACPRLEHLLMDIRKEDAAATLTLPLLYRIVFNRFCALRPPNPTKPIPVALLPKLFTKVMHEFVGDHIHDIPRVRDGSSSSDDDDDDTRRASKIMSTSLIYTLLKEQDAAAMAAGWRTKSTSSSMAITTTTHKRQKVV
jgi:hypothetical protein